MSSNNTACQICGEESLQEVVGFGALPRITSDCRPYPAGGNLYVCLACSGVQKRADPIWVREITDIYASYDSYYQSGGEEQIVFDQATGTPRRRSDVILAGLARSASLPDSGRALDVGCGNGATLTAMSAALTSWSFSGYELGDGALPRLERIPRFERLYTGSFDTIPKHFDLVTMIHALEHFPLPMSALEELMPIVGTGKLFIEVPNVDENPFDILIADHMMHFTPITLKRLLQRAGFISTEIATDWVAKEISLLATGGVAREKYNEVAPIDANFTYRRLERYVDWLERFRDVALATAKDNQLFGLFGTSIAATWLAPQLLDKIAFFVDEDSNRIGREHLGRPVIHPTAVPKDAKVYLALAPRVASMIADRLGNLHCALILPPTAD